MARIFAAGRRAELERNGYHSRNHLAAALTWIEKNTEGGIALVAGALFMSSEEHQPVDSEGQLRARLVEAVRILLDLPRGPCLRLGQVPSGTEAKDCGVCIQCRKTKFLKGVREP